MLFFLILGFSTVGIRLFYLQIIRHGHYSHLAQAQRMRPTTVDPKRGTIFDRNGTVLALSVGADAVYAVPHSGRDHAAAAAQLAPYLSLAEEDIAAALTNVTRSTWLDRKLSWEQSSAIRQLNLPGIRLIERPQRYYPQGTLAAQVLGFAGIDNQGLEGLEFFYDEILRGTPGTWSMERDAAQRQIPGGEGILTPPIHGHDLILTIDAKIQYVAERELERAVVETKSRRGVVLLMDTATGAIVANAVYPAFDPNQYQNYVSSQRRNSAVIDQYEPGSTFKVLTAAAGLDLGAVTFDTMFYSGASWQVAGGRIRSWNRIGHGDQTFVQTLETSDNIAYAQLSVNMGPTQFHPYLHNFGLGQRLGVDFPGEVAGRLPAPGEIRFGETLQWANIGFGQGVAVTPLQLLAAVNAIANEGRLMRPHYVHEIRDHEGNLVHREQPELLGQPIGAATAAAVAHMMRSSVVHGTGSQAEIPGYPVAGKTGTAEVPTQGGYGDDRIASFVGFAPVENPRLTGIVILYYPEQEVRYGGVLAAPVFRTIMEEALDCLGVRRVQQSRTTEDLIIPNVRNMAVLDAQVRLSQAGLTWSYYGDGEYIADQRPTPGTRNASDTVVALYFHESESETVAEVPDVVGLSMRDALTVLQQHGLRMHPVGSGLAFQQMPPAGEAAAEGDLVEVNFSL